MTALLASLGLLPAALSHAIGSDTQRPFAIVIIGGLISSTLLTMLLLPTLYELVDRWFGSERARARRRGMRRMKQHHSRGSRSRLSALCIRGRAWAAPPQSRTMEQAVALRLGSNRDVIAAKLEMPRGQLDQVGAPLYPNPIFSYRSATSCSGRRTQTLARDAPATGFFGSRCTASAISEIIDVWAKRGARIRAAEKGVEYSAGCWSRTRCANHLRGALRVRPKWRANSPSGS